MYEFLNFYKNFVQTRSNKNEILKTAAIILVVVAVQLFRCFLCWFIDERQGGGLGLVCVNGFRKFMQLPFVNNPLP